MITFSIPLRPVYGIWKQKRCKNAAVKTIIWKIEEGKGKPFPSMATKAIM